MEMKNSDFEILHHKEIADGIFDLTLKGGYLEFEPGQFVHVEVTSRLEPFLKRPISICDADPNSLKLVYRVVGKGTKILSEKKPGETLKILGPVGHGFDVNGIKQATIVGGGIGVPPLLGLARKMHAQGIDLEILLGFNSASDAILISEFENYGRMKVATVDGSLGYKGVVTELISDKERTVFACGPEPRYHTLEKQGLKGFYSLERRMACGVGVCLGCNISVKEDERTLRKRVCYNGPVFHIGSVVWSDGNG